MRSRFPALLFVLVLASRLSADVDLEIAAVERTHVERITKSPQTFTIDVAAEDMRPFSRNMVVDDVLQWVSIEGAAQNPRLLVEGMPDLSSADALFASILKPGMSDFEKALAVHTVVARFSVYTSTPRTTWGLDDPILALNGGCGICGNFATWANALARRAGLPARIYEITGHTVSEFFYDGRWHMFDPTTRSFFIGRDNRSVASARELERTPELMRRAGAGRNLVEWFETAENNRVGTDGGVTGWTADVTLRPGETLVRKADKDGPSLWNYEISREERYASGALIWKPDLAQGKIEDLLAGRGNLARSGEPPMLAPDRPLVPAQAAFVVRSPYPITRAALKGRFGKAAANSSLRIVVTPRAPGMTGFPREAFAAAATGLAEQTVDLTPFVFGAFGYDVRFEMASAAPNERTGIESIAFENTLQLNPYALPHLTGGANRITYVDSGAARDVKVACCWREKLPLTSTPWPPMAGRTNTLRASVRNRGSEPAENVAVEFRIPGGRPPLIGTAVVRRIGPGETAAVEVPWRPTRPFRTWLEVTADPKNAIPESDEKNNSFSRGFRLCGPADLSVSPSQVTVERAGGKAHLEALVVNVGASPARDVEVEFLTGDGKAGRPVGRARIPLIHATNFSTEEINPYGRATLDVDAAQLTGSRLGVAVDPDRRSDDPDRENNTAWAGGDDPVADPLTFFSFEPNQGELHDAEAEGLASAAEVEAYATHGKRSAVLVFPANQVARLRLLGDGTDVQVPRAWGAFARLRIDATNLGGAPAPLAVRVLTVKDGRRGSVSDALFEIPPGGPVVLDLPLADLAEANLGAVEAVEILSDRPALPVAVAIDNLRLARRTFDRGVTVVSPKRVHGEVRELGSTAEPRAIALAGREDLRRFSPCANAPAFVPGFAPGAPSAAEFAFGPGRPAGLTLDLTRSDSPWPMDWRACKRLAFDAQGLADEPVGIGLRIRSSHPENGVKLFVTSVALRRDGGTHSIDIASLADRLDLDGVTHATWFVWNPRFSGVFRLANLRLEK